MIDILDLISHLPGATLRNEDAARFTIVLDDAEVHLAIAHWATVPEHSICALSIGANDAPTRSVLFTAREFNEQLREIANAILSGAPWAWIGSAREQHAALRQAERAACELALCAAARRWALLREGVEVSSSGAAVQGAGPFAARLEIDASARSAVVVRGYLGEHVLFESSATLADAPALAVRAVDALEAGERLPLSAALTVQREAQAVFLHAVGALDASDDCAACEAERRTSSAGGRFESLLARAGVQP